MNVISNSLRGNKSSLEGIDNYELLSNGCQEKN